MIFILGLLESFLGGKTFSKSSIWWLNVWRTSVELNCDAAIVEKRMCIGFFLVWELIDECVPARISRTWLSKNFIPFPLCMCSFLYQKTKNIVQLAMLSTYKYALGHLFLVFVREEHWGHFDTYMLPQYLLSVYILYGWPQ